MEFGNLDLYNFLDSYKRGIENILKTRSFKVLENEFYLLSESLKVNDILSLSNLNQDSLKNLLEDKKIIYLPFVGGFDSYVRCVNGSEFDLDEGMDNDWIEGVGYIPSGSRIIDVGDFTVSYKNIAGFIFTKENNIYKVRIAEYLKGQTSVKEIINSGLLGIEIKNFIEEFNI